MSKSDVELRLPAQSAYVSVLRMTTAGLAARLDFTLDDIEDLRIAVGEACALLLEHASADGSITTTFVTEPGTMRLVVCVETEGTAAVDRDNFGWQVLTALVDDLAEDSVTGRTEIAFTVASAKV